MRKVYRTEQLYNVSKRKEQGKLWYTFESTAFGFISKGYDMTIKRGDKYENRSELVEHVLDWKALLHIAQLYDELYANKNT